MTVVVDASVVVAALVDSGPTGEWSAAALMDGGPAAPELMPFEVANVLRRLEGRDGATSEMMSLAHRDLLRLDIALWPYLAVADEAWRQRGNLSLYDAAYVALARQLDVPLLTLDERLTRTARSLCRVRTPAEDA